MRQIIVDADKFEHLLNCMAQLNFLPVTGIHADEPIIRQAYADAREMLHNPPAPENACDAPVSPREEALSVKLDALVIAVQGYCGKDGSDGSRAIQSWFANHGFVVKEK